MSWSADGSWMAAKKATAPKMPKPAKAMRMSRLASSPKTAPIRMATVAVATSSASLSLVPKIETMKSLAPGG